MTTGRDALRRDPLGRGDAVELRHLDVQHDQVGSVFLDQLDRPLTVAGLAHDVVPLLAEHLGEVEPDQGLVLRDHHARPAYVVSGAVVTGSRLSDAV